MCWSFPANRTSQGRFAFEGKTYQLPINEPAFGNHLHGRMYNAPFEIISVSGNEVTAVYENHDERYPFRMRIADRLDINGMTRTLTIINTGDTAMHYIMAFHTAFAEPEFFSAEIGVRHERSASYVPTGRTEAMMAEEHRFSTGIAPKGLAISSYYTAAGSKARLDRNV